MNLSEINSTVKEILIDSLNLKISKDELSDEQLLFGTDENPGIFDDSLCVLEVTSALIAEFDVDASCFNGESFVTVASLVESINQAVLEIKE